MTWAWPELQRPAHHSGRIPNSNPVVCGRKFCSCCGKWRLISDFGPYSSTRNGVVLLWQSRCRTCTRAIDRKRRGYGRSPRKYGRATRKEEWEKQRAYWAAHPEARDARREYERIYAEAQRRKLGMKVRVYRDPDRRADKTAQRVPKGPLVDALVRWLESPQNALGQLSEASGVQERRIWALLHEENENVTLSTADRLVTAMGSHLHLVYDD